MTSNVGTPDRVLRIIAGVALIAVALGLFGSAYQTVWGWVGVVPLTTGLLGWCPLYKTLDLKTCRSVST
jgi:Protein of unknown function (DUF2892)